MSKKELNERKINVDFFPYSGGGNPYIDLLRQGVEKAGKCNIREFSMSIKKYIKHNETDIVYLNWFDNVQNKTRIRTLYSIIKRLAILHTIKTRGTKIFIVIHNRLPHNVKNEKLIKWYMSRLFSLADVLPILSKGTTRIIQETFGNKIYENIKKKCTLIPVTHYIGVYPLSADNLRRKLNISNQDFVYLFWGSIEPYKNIELLINVAHRITNDHKDAYFIIAGKCDKEYENELHGLIDKNSQIIIIPGRIEDNELADLIDASNIVVVPLDIRSSINSGTCFVTFSLERTIICPRIPGIADFENQVFFDYIYKDNEEHALRLYEKCEEAYSEYKTSPDIFKQRGKKIKDELTAHYSNETIGKKLSDEFVKCMK